MSSVLANERITGNRHTAVGETRLEERDGVVVVRLYGVHDLATKDALRVLLERLVRDAKPVVVSIVNVDFMDCAALGVLSKADELASRLHDRRVVLHHGTSQSVRRLLEATAFLEGIPHSRELVEAIALAGRPRHESLPRRTLGHAMPTRPGRLRAAGS
jgi:anti-anti-sigma factor